MVASLPATHKPQTLEEAATLLKRPGAYPLYGSSPALIRHDNYAIKEIIDLSAVLPARCEFRTKQYWIDGRATLTTVASSDEYIGAIAKEEAPDTLYDTVAIGDVMTKCRSDSLLMALLWGLDARIQAFGQGQYTLAGWYDLSPDERRQQVIQGVAFSYYPIAPIRFVVEKDLSATDGGPVLASIGFARGGFRYSTKVDFYCVVCGLNERPTLYQPRDIQSQIDEIKSGVPQRSDIAKALSQKAILRAVTWASEGYL